MHPWAIMGYYPAGVHTSETFFRNVPHFILFMCVVFVSATCGWGIANAADLRPSYQHLGMVAGSLFGIAVGSIIFLG